MNTTDIVGMPSVHCWSTSTSLKDTNKERKTYFLTILDGERKIEFSLEHYREDNRIVAVPYQPADYDYTEYDGGDDWCDGDDYYADYYDDDDEEYDPDDADEETA